MPGFVPQSGHPHPRVLVWLHMKYTGHVLLQHTGALYSRWPCSATVLLRFEGGSDSGRATGSGSRFQ